MPLTEEQFRECLPSNIKKSVNPLLIMKINNLLDKPEEWVPFKENLLSYTGVLQKGKFKMDSYINAIRYVSYKIMGCSNKEAYKKTFPDKYMNFLAQGVAEKDIASYSTAYNKSKLVNLIFEQTLVPSYILNAPLFQKAINTQAEIMSNEDASFKVRSDAANSLMTHLKPPETQRVELDIGIEKTSVIEEYQMAMTKMVEQQMKMIEAGADVKQIANAAIKTKKEDVVDI